MKKLLLLTAFVWGCINANAQNKLTLSTYNGTDLQKYAGKTLQVSISRYLFNGWNTVSLPFDMNETQVNAAFGDDCKLERLAGVENDGQNIKLNFQDCKSDGIKANVPYILYYKGNSGTKNITLEKVTISDTPSPISFTAQGTGESVTMVGTPTKRSAQGVYGILADDNAEAAFVNVNDIETGFYATRCYIELSNGNSTLLMTNHIDKNVTSIHSISKPNETIDVYNISGIKVAENISAAEISTLQKGIYIIKGRKVAVK